MANNKLNKPKSSETMDTLGAKMRWSNNCHDGEMQMLIAIGEALGMKITFNEKEGTVTVEKDANFRPTETAANSSPPHASPSVASPVTYTLDKKNCWTTSSLSCRPVTRRASLRRTTNVGQESVTLSDSTMISVGNICSARS